MKLYVDLDSLQFIEGPGFRSPVSTLRFKRGDAARLEVVFLTNGTTPATIGDPGTLEIHFGAKLNGQYGADYLVHTADWTMPAAPPASPVYSCSPSFNTVALDAALALGGSELDQITLMAEITWREGTGEPTSTRTVLVVVDNDVNRGAEGTAQAAPDPENWLSLRAVRHDAPQVIPSLSQAQARLNIDAAIDTSFRAINILYNAYLLADGDEVYIGSYVYTVRAVPANPGEIPMNLTSIATIITYGGDTYNPTPHPDVTATEDGEWLTVIARASGEFGNGISCWVGSSAATWQDGATYGGHNGSLDTALTSAETPDYWTYETAGVTTAYLLLRENSGPLQHYFKITLSSLWDWFVTKLAALGTISGAKTFSGQVELQAQSAASATSALTRGLVDARQVYVRQGTNFVKNASASPTDTALAVVLGVGVWEITAMLPTSSVSGTPGARFKMTFSGALNADGYDRFAFIQSTSGGTNANVYAAALNANYDSVATSSDYYTVIAPSVIRVTTAGTLKVQFSQKTATAENTTLSLVSSLLARRISH